MKKVGPLKLYNSLLCDDIRLEAETKKHILIGVYSGDIRVKELPASFRMAFYLDWWGPAGNHEFEIRLSGPGKDKAVLNARIDLPKPGSATLVSPKLDVLLEREGVLRIDARVAPGKWVSLIKKQIIVDPSVGGAIASAPPPEQSESGAPETVSPPEPGPRASRSRKKKRP